MALKIQLWSYNYDPEPTGIGPVSRVWAEGLRDRGHLVEVVAAHPHYPEPVWGSRMLPYREVRNGIPVLRLPLWIGRDTAVERYRQELSFMAAQFAALPVLSRPDVLVSASPSFPALFPAMLNARVRRMPWIIWLHDILPDGAASSGIVDEGSPVIRTARRLEHAAYSEADRIVVLSEAFTHNLTAKGVPDKKIQLIYDPATRVPRHTPFSEDHAQPPRLLSMGNIGYSQGLAPLVAAFERSDALGGMPIQFIITGNGMAAEDTRSEIRSERVEMPGVVDDERLEGELRAATIAFVSQQHEGAEFNIPSKIMNFMAYGLPVLAAVNPGGEVARIVERAGAGWVVDSSDPDSFPRRLAEILRAPAEIAARGRAAYEYAQHHFTQAGFAERFDDSLREVVERHRTAL
ncbi:MAG TPA: glycosyltransferase family 4 protein [Candidatus Acidoferrum sp.]|jgi:colanic acid biosynthesis glycosyl transferase WcaI|nr:glycosyltransferase family 4 protein [Candidatus Acidoferrum sp.]